MSLDPTALLEGLAEVLQDAGLGVLADGAGDAPTLFINRVPDSPEELLALFSTGGFPDIGAYESVTPVPTVQLRGRSRSQRDAAGLVAAAHKKLLSLKNVSLSTGVRVLQVETLAPPGYIGEDEKGRREFTSNLSLTLGRFVPEEA